MTKPKTMLRRLIIATLALSILAIAGAWAAYLHFDRTPGELMRYTERRLIGHPKLEFVILPIFNFLRSHIERPVDDLIPAMGKGQQPNGLKPQTYTSTGTPIPAIPLENPPTIRETSQQILVASVPELQQAINNAHAGQTIEILPGTYRVKGVLRTRSGGTSEQPIRIRASVPGSVIIESEAMEGFHLIEPYWIVENLLIQGKCQRDHDCEHAFHVAGKARGTVIRNNRIEDFNAQIKVNGGGGHWPDDGLIQYNTIRNNHRRETHLPVTPIDIVGADRWVIADNTISDFVKGDGNQVSFGVFMKGAGSDGRIERNLIVCTTHNISQSGFRVGLSFGGGGTGQPYCRDKQCTTEYNRGIAVNNIIAHCNDFGIYLNKAKDILIAHNTLLNTSGIDIRFPESSAKITANIVEGRIRQRDGGTAITSHNPGPSDRMITPSLQTAVQSLELENVVTVDRVTDDFCKQPRPARSHPGALASEACP